MINPNNATNFVGRLTKDPEESTVGKGKNAFTKVKFQVAIDRILSKEKRDEAKNDDSIITADFPFFEATGGTADFIANFFHKGDPISMVCTYVSFKYEDKNGNDVYGHNFKVEGASFVPGPAKDNKGSKGSNRNSRRNDDEDEEDERPSRNNKPSRNSNKSSKSRKEEYDDEDLEGIDDEDIPF